MPRVNVWTQRDMSSSWESGKPKCIFSGEIMAVPHVGDMIVLRNGFCSEVVKSVTHDFVTGNVEIHIAGWDRNNEYGPCLLFPPKDN